MPISLCVNKENIYFYFILQIREGGKHKKFRSIDEIREDFKKLNMDMKTDLEVLNSIFEQYKKKDLRTEDRVSLLKDLEYYVHQV